MEKNLVKMIDENKLLKSYKSFDDSTESYTETVGGKIFEIACNAFLITYFTAPIWAPVLTYLSRK